MTAIELVIRGRRVLTGGRVVPASLHVAGGRIAAVEAFDAPAGAAEIVDAGDLLVTQGLVDAHVHVNEPGRTEWEGFASATAAAAAGGVTTIVDMPLNCVPATTTSAALAAKRDAMAGQAHVDVALWGGLVPGNAGALAALAEAGAAGIKCFMCPSGVDEFPHVGRRDLEEALPLLREFGLPLLVHAESPAALERAAAAAAGDPRHYATYLATRPAAAETEAAQLLIELVRRHRAHVHVVHVSSAETLDTIADARTEGLPLSAETCPHYLTFAAEEIADGATQFKCAPPIRSAAHREALWDGLARGVLALVATDHSPCPPALKRPDDGDFLTAWGGIASLQLLLPALWSGARARGHGVAALLDWAAGRPAMLAGLGSRKGRLAAGFDADVVIWDERATFTVAPADLLHRHPLTPYAGLTLRGVVHETRVRGRLAFRRGSGPAAHPAGTFLPVDRRRPGPALTI